MPVGMLDVFSNGGLAFLARPIRLCEKTLSNLRLGCLHSQKRCTALLKDLITLFESSLLGNKTNPKNLLL